MATWRNIFFHLNICFICLLIVEKAILYIPVNQLNKTVILHIIKLCVLYLYFQRLTFKIKFQFIYKKSAKAKPYLGHLATFCDHLRRCESKISKFILAPCWECHRHNCDVRNDSDRSNHALQCVISLTFKFLSRKLMDFCETLKIKAKRVFADFTAGWFFVDNLDLGALRMSFVVNINYKFSINLPNSGSWWIFKKKSHHF
jgi:hypothetical protein